MNSDDWAPEPAAAQPKRRRPHPIYFLTLVLLALWGFYHAWYAHRVEESCRALSHVAFRCANQLAKCANDLDVLARHKPFRGESF